MNKFVVGIISLWLIPISCTRPVAVTHWDAKERAIVRKSRILGKDVYGYPIHTRLSSLVCMNKNCINRQESINFNKKYRFKGYKNNAPPPRRVTTDSTATEPVIAAKTEKQPVSKPAVNYSQILQHVYFETGKAQLKPESAPELDELLAMLQQNPGVSIIVSGHTDNTGNEKTNLTLSRQRAEAVIEYLAQKGISKNRLSARGFGSSRPVTSNDSVEGRNQNRRVEFMTTSTGK
jgi:outer membrane protein OmpA-like peptidoglycan-associated protein